MILPLTTVDKSNDMLFGGPAGTGGSGHHNLIRKEPHLFLPQSNQRDDLTSPKFRSLDNSRRENSQVNLVDRKRSDDKFRNQINQTFRIINFDLQILCLHNNFYQVQESGTRTSNLNFFLSTRYHSCDNSNHGFVTIRSGFRIYL